MSCEAGSAPWQNLTLVLLVITAGSHSLLVLGLLSRRVLGCLGLGLLGDFITILLCIIAVVLFAGLLLGLLLFVDVFLFTILSRSIDLLLVGGSSLGLLRGRSLACFAEKSAAEGQ